MKSSVLAKMYYIFRNLGFGILEFHKSFTASVQIFYVIEIKYLYSLIIIKSLSKQQAILDFLYVKLRNLCVRVTPKEK